MELKTQIIIVDDVIDFAKQNAAFIETKCRIGCMPLGASDDDLIKLKNAILDHPIKIVILDQVLKKDRSLLGTNLMPSLRELNPNLQFIMLTGNASREDLFEAKRLGFSDLIDKTEWSDRMSDIIYDHICKYDNSIKIKNTVHHNKVLKRGFFKHWILLSEEVVNEEYVDEKKWKSSNRIDRGKDTEKTVEVELSINDELIITSERTIDVNLTAKLKSLFDSEISAKESNGIKRAQQIKNTMSITTHETLSLGQDEKFKEKNVIAKVYQENQLYKQILLHVAVVCRFCKHEDIIPIYVFIPLSKKRCRQVYFTDDNKEHYVKTGIMDI